MTCPWLGLCDYAEEVPGRKDEHCLSGYYESCPTWKEDPYMNYEKDNSSEQRNIEDEE